MSEAEALKSLGAFPLVQAAVAILVLMAGVWLVIRAGRDKKPGDATLVPPWLMMGPAHDVMGAIHDLAEQSRGTNHVLERSEVLLNDIAKDLRTQTQLLEMIANENMINPRRLRE